MWVVTYYLSAWKWCMLSDIVLLSISHLQVFAVYPLDWTRWSVQGRAGKIHVLWVNTSSSAVKNVTMRRNVASRGPWIWNGTRKIMMVVVAVIGRRTRSLTTMQSEESPWLKRPRRRNQPKSVSFLQRMGVVRREVSVSFATTSQVEIPPMTIEAWQAGNPIGEAKKYLGRNNIIVDNELVLIV